RHPPPRHGRICQETSPPRGGHAGRPNPQITCFRRILIRCDNPRLNVVECLWRARLVSIPKLVRRALALFLLFSSPSLADYSISGHPSDFEARVSLNATGPSGDYDPANSTTNSNLRIGVAG